MIKKSVIVMIKEVIKKIIKIVNFKTIVVEGEVFYKYQSTKSLTCSFAVNKTHIIKVEHKKNEMKINSLIEEAKIIRYLNQKRCVSCPKLIKTGHLESGEFFLIEERIYSKKSPTTADMLLALIEQKKLGIYQGDFKPENMIFDGKVCYLIDYDQAQKNDKFINMNNVDFITWMENDFRERRGLEFFMDPNRNFDKNEFIGCFKNGSFDLGLTTLLKLQMTTNTTSGFYHKFNNQDILLEGARDIDKRISLLDKINFYRGEKVLDVGCNLGLLSHYFYDRGCLTAGLDMDSCVIKAAQILANIFGKNIHYFQSDMDKNKFEEEYDTICLFSVLHHFKHMKKNANFLSKKCRRVILEARLKEVGSKPILGFWTQTSRWKFGNIDEMISFMEKELFEGFVYEKDWGLADRNRHVISFIKK